MTHAVTHKNVYNKFMIYHQISLASRTRTTRAVSQMSDALIILYAIVPLVRLFACSTLQVQGAHICLIFTRLPLWPMYQLRVLWVIHSFIHSSTSTSMNVSFVNLYVLFLFLITKMFGLRSCGAFRTNVLGEHQLLLDTNYQHTDTISYKNIEPGKNKT